MNQQLQNSYSCIYYYAREGLWRTLQKQCIKDYQKYNDPFFKFWRSYGLYKEGSVTEAINELNQLKQKKEIQNASLQALLVYHQNQKSLDREAISEIKRAINDSQPNDKQLSIICWFFILNNEVRKAAEIIQQTNSVNILTINMNGWIEIYKNTNNSCQNALQIFTECIDKNGSHLDLLLGKCVASEKLKKFTITIDAINSAIVDYPDFIPAQDIKTKVLVMIGDWEQAIELAQTVIYQDPDNIQVSMILLFNQIARIGGPEESLEQMKSFVQKLDKIEPQNNELFFYASKLYSRLCSQDPNIIQITQDLLQKCKQTDPLNADYPLELANQYLMIKNYSQAFQFFQESASLGILIQQKDETKVESLSGMINCKILDGHLEDAIQQIQFLNDITTDGKTSQVAYLEALIFIQQNNTQDAIKCLDESLKIHIIKSKNLVPDIKFYVSLDPNFLFCIAESYLSLKDIDTKQIHLVKGIKLMETITNKIPGYISAHILLSKGKLNQGNPSGALKSINRSLEIDPQNRDARIYQAMISIKEGNFQQAESSLDQAISQNFKIRENPVFLLLKGEVELKSGNLKQATSTFETLFNLPGIKIGQQFPQTEGMFAFQDQQRCQVYLNLAKVYARNQKLPQAKQIIDEAISEWAGSQEEVQVLMANSEIQLQNGDIKKAIDILKTVDKQNANFNDSRKQMADIYLKQLKDRRNYAKCYVDLIEVSPTFENYKLLANALLSIQEPEDAIIYFKQAQQINPSDEEITREIGYCLTQTHDFHKAIRYYENSLMQNPKRIDLMLDLGKIYTQIGNFDKAEQFLQPQLFSEEYQQPSIQALKRNIQGFIAIYELNLAKSEDGNEYCRKALEKSIQMQGDLIERCKQEGYALEPERKTISELYLKLSNYLVKFENNDSKALNYLDRALKYNVSDEQIYQLMISIHFKTEDFDECYAKCKQLSKINPRNEYASLMMSELMIINNQGQQALEQFEQLFQKSPQNMGLLSKLIIIYIRNGDIKKAQECLQKAENLSQNKNEPGMCFCRGILYKNLGQPSKALKEFNKAKIQQAYVDESVRHMLEIFINPNQDLYFSYSEEINSVKQIDPENTKGAENALLDSKDRSTDQIRFMSLFAKLLLFGKSDLQIITGVSLRKKLKPQEFIEQASSILTKILQDKPNSHASLLYLAIAKYQQKKIPESKQCLQKIIKSNYQSDQGEIFEMASLIMADGLMYEKNFNEAERILKHAFMYNKNNGKIMELLGVIQEKQQETQLATQCYQKGWELTNFTSASIGYRLAQSYLKLKKIPQCIEVCEKIIKQYPNYPRIDKEIMQKAILMIKTSSSN